jgi:ABC-type transport system involved in multi-copper enzyme maturation permease subunit
MYKILAIARTVLRETLRRKDLYVLLILLVAMLFWLMSLKAFGMSGAVRYVMDLGFLLAWMCTWILTVALAGRQLPEEERRGSIFTLLAKPVTRFEVVAGKWLGAVFASAAATALMYAVILLLVGLRGGALDKTTLVQAYVLHLALLGVLAALAIAFSARFHFDAAVTLTYVASLTAYAVAPRIPEMLLFEEAGLRPVLRALYYLLPHLELFDMRNRLIHAWGPAPWPVVAGVLIYGLLWSALLLVAGWLVYRRKRFSRDVVG